jgi:hypothetical protein
MVRLFGWLALLARSGISETAVRQARRSAFLVSKPFTGSSETRV